MAFDKGEEDIKTLTKALEDKPKFARLCVYTLNCFKKLSKNRKNLDRIANEGSFKTILNTMKHHPKNSRVIMEGVGSLITACSVKEYAVQISECNGVEFCLEQLKNSNDGASNARVSDLLEALCNGDPRNVEKIKKLGGEDVLREKLTEALQLKNNQLASSILSLLKSLTDDQNFAKTVSKETVKNVVQSLKEMKKNPDVVVPAVAVIKNLVKYSSPEMIEFLKELGVVGLLSQAMDENSTNKQLAALGKEVLLKLTDKSDMQDAINRLKVKALETVEKKKVVALIGNLSLISENKELLSDMSVIEKLAKIIKSSVKLHHTNQSEQRLLISAIKSAGKIASLSEEKAKFFEKNILDKLLKLLKSEKLNADLLTSVNVASDSYVENEYGFNAVVSHKELLNLLLEKNMSFNDEHSITSMAHFCKHFSQRPVGMKALNDLNYISSFSQIVTLNIKNSKLVIECYEAFIGFTNNIEQINDDNLLSMMKSALLGLEDDPQNIPVCEKALEILQILAEKSMFVSTKLGEYEYGSVLNKFKNETENVELQNAVDALKASLSYGAPQTVAEKIAIPTVEKLLEDIAATSEQVDQGSSISQMESLFKLCEQLSTAMAIEENKEQVKQLDGVKVLSKALNNVHQALPSEIQISIIKILVSLLNDLNEKGDYCSYLQEVDHYSTLGNVYSLSLTTSDLRSEIEKSLKIFAAKREELRDQVFALEKTDSDYSETIIRKLLMLVDDTLIVNSFPDNLKSGLIDKQTEMDKAVELLKDNLANEGVVNATVKYLDSLSDDQAMKNYFSKMYIGSVCAIIKSNADDDSLCVPLLTILSDYESNKYAVTEISDLKKWYIGHTFETDIEAFKTHIINQIYEAFGTANENEKIKPLLQKLQYCYDSKNELYQADAEPTKIDEEVVMLIKHVFGSQTAQELYNEATKLMKQMSSNPKIEAMFFEKNIIQRICENLITAQTRSERILFMSALTPFINSKNPLIKEYITEQLNKLISMSERMSDTDRMNLLQDLITYMKDDTNKIRLSSECLESVLALFEIQKTPEGKSKTLSIIAKMTKSSREIASQFTSGRGLTITMESLHENVDSRMYVEQMSQLTCIIAEYNECVDAMFAQKVDSTMKRLMFDYTEDMNIFHNSQRTIDLMYMSKLNLSSDEIEKWKSRSRIKQLVTELCRGLGIMICCVLTKGEREVRTGDTTKDISTECLRILNEFGSSFDETIEANSSTRLLMWLGEAWLLRAYLMAYTFLVEKDVSARSVLNAPKTIQDTLVSKCGFTAVWDFENDEFNNSHRAVRGGIAHQTARMVLDSSITTQTVQEVDLVSKEPFGKEYTLEDLIIWIKMDEEEKDVPRVFNLLLKWTAINWNLVTITCSMAVNRMKNGELNIRAINRDGSFLSLRCGLEWQWEKRVDAETMYVYNTTRTDPYEVVRSIKKDSQKGGLHIKVKISGEELRQKRRKIKDSLDFSHSNVLNGDEKDELDFFIEFSGKGMQARRYNKQLFNVKKEPTFIKFNQEEDGDLYFSWGKENGERSRFNMKEIEAVLKGKQTKTMKKVKDALEDNVFVVQAAGEREVNIMLESTADRDIWVQGLKLTLCAVANRPPKDMKWE